MIRFKNSEKTKTDRILIMKIKPIYIYITIIVVALITIISVSSSENTKEELSKAPNDEVHNSLMQQKAGEPSGSNVNREIFDRIKKYEDQITQNPSDTAAMKEYAELLFAAHKQDKAIELYEKILIASPNRIDILKILSIIEFNKGDFLSSKTKIEKILSLNPKDPEALYNLGVIETKVGDIEAARIQWENLLKFHPNTKMSDMAKESLAKLSANSQK